MHYPTDVIAQCIRWLLAYSLSLRNLEERMAERSIIVDYSTLHRRVIRLVPVLDKAFRRYKRAVGPRWRMDETCIRVRGQWKYLYRAVDTAGQTLDFLLTARRDADKPDEESITTRQNKYRNTLAEQDHRNIKRPTRPMTGFKSFRRAQTLLAGIERVNMISKGQLHHPADEGLSSAERFYLLAAWKTGSADLIIFTPLTRQSPLYPFQPQILPQRGKLILLAKQPTTTKFRHH
ncbi:IS6 family transposase [Pantoea sp. AS142]|uniref:IS6 family transposase n=1 Tax=Pantoea sp. AS142 TaxID=3081292 RepID=UPI003FA6E383